MRYEPVKIVGITMIKGLRSMSRKEALERASARNKPDYYIVRSKLFGDCAHKHKSEKAAEPCRDNMKKQWTAWRSAISRMTKGISRSVLLR